jgi:hypothetical protein
MNDVLANFFFVREIESPSFLALLFLQESKAWISLFARDEPMKAVIGSVSLMTLHIRKQDTCQPFKKPLEPIGHWSNYC